MHAGDGAFCYILLTDIGRSSHLWEQFPLEYPAALEAHNKLSEACITSQGGEVMKNLGDGYMALFHSADSALAAAVELQLQLAGAQAIPNFPDGSAVQVRAVLHGGTLRRLATGLGWFGTPLHRTARIAKICLPGQTVLSSAARTGLAEALPAQCQLRSLGLFTLRDLDEPEHLFELIHPALPPPVSPASKGDARLARQERTVRAALVTALAVVVVALLLALANPGLGGDLSAIRNEMRLQRIKLEQLRQQNEQLERQLHDLSFGTDPLAPNAPPHRPALPE